MLINGGPIGVASIGKIALCALLAPLLTTPLPQNGSLTAPICIFEYIEYIEYIEYTENIWYNEYTKYTEYIDYTSYILSYICKKTPN